MGLLETFRDFHEFNEVLYGKDEVLYGKDEVFHGKDEVLRIKSVLHG